MTRSLPAALVVALALTASACQPGGGDDTPSAAGTIAPDDASQAESEPPVDENPASTTPTATDDPATIDATASPVAQVDFAQASVHMEITGSFERSIDLETVIDAQYGGDQPNVLISVTESADTSTASWNLVFPIGTTEGEIDDSGDIYLAYTVLDDAGNERVFFNIDTGCSIVVEEASPEGVSGTWECPQNVAADDESVVIDAGGTFSTSP